MSEAVNAEILQQLLSRIPGASWSCRIFPLTGKSEWVYLDAKTAEIYDVPLDDLRADPNLTMRQVLPEDALKIYEETVRSVETLASFTQSSRVLRRSGELRWIDLHIAVEPEPAGSVVMYGQIFDVTERKRLERALADSEESRRKADLLHRAVIDALPIGIIVVSQAREFVMLNPAQRRLGGDVVEHEEGDMAQAYGIFMADGVTPFPMEDGGMARALRGEAREEEVLLRNSRLANDVRLHMSWTSLRDESGAVDAALGVSQDITAQRALEDELRARNEELAASEEAKSTLIERLRYSIDELSNPILEIWDDVLVMPIIGVVDSRRTADMVQRLLAEVTRTQASFVIIDLTGVEIVDTKTADHLMRLMRKVEVVGARCVLTGIRAAVAETLVDIGVDFGRITTLRNLKHGLREALRFGRREQEGTRRDHDPSPAADDDDEKPRGRAR